VTPQSSVGNGQIVTPVGRRQQDALHPPQQAFIDEQGVQCGYCINGMIVQAAAYLQQTPHPTENDVRA
jgi:nicotinate dehydrogenase subunit A